MRILAMDSSGLVASAAVWEDGRVIGSYSVSHKKTHSQTLLPMMEELLTMLELSPQDLDAIAVAAGPGSFTGLRIGAATAKGMALALDLPILAVPTVDALAYVLWGAEGIVCPLMNARREQVYTGLYRFAADGAMEVLVPQRVCLISEILEEVNQRGASVTFLGDGVSAYLPQIESGCHVPYRLAPAHREAQSAEAVAVLGAQLYAQGKAQSADAFRPEYLRLSQAERERRIPVKLRFYGGKKREVTPEDEPLSLQMESIGRQVFGPEAWNAPAFADALCAPYSLIVVADAAETSLRIPGDAAPSAETASVTASLKGCLGYAVFSCAADEAELLLVAVDPKVWRHGIAAQILEAAEPELRNRGVKTVFLEVREHNEAAKALYDRMGFAAAGRRPRFYQEPEEDALIYRKSLL